MLAAEGGKMPAPLGKAQLIYPLAKTQSRGKVFLSVPFNSSGDSLKRWGDKERQNWGDFLFFTTRREQSAEFCHLIT